MPGFQLERFVELSEAERTELQCVICRDILKNPVFVECYLQTFCDECINQWLTNNSICPYDRQELTKAGLTRPAQVWHIHSLDFVSSSLWDNRIFCTKNSVRMPIVKCELNSGIDFIRHLSVEMVWVLLVLMRARIWWPSTKLSRFSLKTTLIDSLMNLK